MLILRTDLKALNENSLCLYPITGNIFQKKTHIHTKGYNKNIKLILNILLQHSVIEGLTSSRCLPIKNENQNVVYVNDWVTTLNAKNYEAE